MYAFGNSLTYPMSSAMDENWSIIFADHPQPKEELQFGPHPRQAIDIFGDARCESAILFVHGGFWRPEHDRTHARTALDALGRAGVQCFSIDYRCIPGKPSVMFSDVSKGIDKVRPLVEGRPTTLVGHSAGGLIALTLDMNENEPWWERIVCFAPVTDVARARELNLGEGAVHDMFPDPVLDSTFALQAPRCARVNVLHGTRDTRVPLSMSREYADRTRSQLTTFPDVGHFEFIDPQSRVWPEVRTLLGPVK